jgi:putative hydrolase of the HAD superfamily
MRRLLLDFGGVVIRTPFELQTRVGAPGWGGPFSPDSDPLWRESQTGVITEREYWHIRAEEAFGDADDPVRKLMGTIFAPPPDDVVRPEVASLIAEVERPAVLTNDLARFHDKEWLVDMGLDGTFDPLIDLSYIGYLKPERRAFTHALSELGEDAGDVVFVDDQPANVAGAEAQGLIAVWFDVTDPAGSVSRVRELL